ncbi:MAG TPA: flagellar hook-length control protein FliK [Phycisphaerales bacterium]|nr:flagellar hook-length control protein FliK [Phycisphaerales bacterium]
MKPLPAAPAPLLQLNGPLGVSPVTAHSKAQKLRTHAQSKREAADPAAFKEKLRDHRAGKNDTTDRAEQAELAQRPGASGSSPQQRGPEQAGTPGDKPVQEACAREAVPPADPANQAETTADDTCRENATQEFISQVMEVVDPALRTKPTAAARSETTVAGNAASAMKSGGISAKPSSEFVAGEKHDASSVEGTPAAGGETDGGAAVPSDFIAVTPIDGETPRRDAPSHQGAHENKPPASDRPASAVERAGVSVAAGGTSAAPRVEEPRITLTPTLTALTPAVSTAHGRAVAAKAGVAGQKTVAEQVQHGLDVAMHELPAPAGERLVTLKLHPSTLGSIRIAVQVSGDRVNVRFQVGSAKAKAAIGQAIGDLQASIARQGLRVESLEVEEDSALAAPDRSTDGPAAAAAAGKGFATHPSAPPGPPVGPGADDGTGRTPEISPDAEYEGGVLQVLTFRLDAVG